MKKMIRKLFTPLIGSLIELAFIKHSAAIYTEIKLLEDRIIDLEKSLIEVCKDYYGGKDKQKE